MNQWLTKAVKCTSEPTYFQMLQVFESGFIQSAVWHRKKPKLQSSHAAVSSNSIWVSSGERFWLKLFSLVFLSVFNCVDSGRLVIKPLTSFATLLCCVIFLPHVDSQVFPMSLLWESLLKLLPSTRREWRTGLFLPSPFQTPFYSILLPKPGDFLNTSTSTYL